MSRLYLHRVFEIEHDENDVVICYNRRGKVIGMVTGEMWIQLREKWERLMQRASYAVEWRRAAALA